MTTYYDFAANPELTRKELDEKLGQVSDWKELCLEALEALTHADERHCDAVQRRILELASTPVPGYFHWEIVDSKGRKRADGTSKENPGVQVCDLLRQYSGYGAHRAVIDYHEIKVTYEVDEDEE